MQQAIFERMLEEIYSAFGRERPRGGSPSYVSLWRRVVEERNVPDAAARPIAYALSEYDTLPVNLGKAILAEFAQWLDRHPARRRSTPLCAQCSADMPGWFWATDAEGRRMACKCACNNDPAYAHLQSWTREQAACAGLRPLDAVLTKAARPLHADTLPAEATHPARPVLTDAAHTLLTGTVRTLLTGTARAKTT